MVRVEDEAYYDLEEPGQGNYQRRSRVHAIRSMGPGMALENQGQGKMGQSPSRQDPPPPRIPEMAHGSRSSSRSLFRSNLTSAMAPHSPGMAFSIQFHSSHVATCHRFARNSIRNPCSKLELGRLFRRLCYWMSDDRYLVLRTACGSAFAQRIERLKIPSSEEACPPLLATSFPSPVLPGQKFGQRSASSPLDGCNSQSITVRFGRLA